jgi:hypothetical protein
MMNDDDNVRATLFRYWLVLDFLCYVTVTCHDVRPFRFAVLIIFDPSTKNRLVGTWLVWNVKLKEFRHPNFRILFGQTSLVALGSEKTVEF